MAGDQRHHQVCAERTWIITGPSMRWAPGRVNQLLAPVDIPPPTRQLWPMHSATTSTGSNPAISLRGRYFFVWFTGRSACGWPETLLTHWPC